MLDKDSKTLRKEYDAWLQLLKRLTVILPALGMMVIYIAISAGDLGPGLLGVYLIVCGPASHRFRRYLEANKTRFCGTVDAMDDLITDPRFTEALRDAFRKNGIEIS